MSVRALTWSFNLRLFDMAAKAVLHALADHADEGGRCWPSVARVALFAGCSEKTARRALQRIAELDIVRREPRAGQSDIFVLNFEWHPSHDGSGQIGSGQSDPLPTRAEPLPNCPATPPTVTRHPSQRGSRTVKEPSKNPQSNHQSTPDVRPHRLPADWQPSQDCRNFAADRGLNPDSVAEAFIDYWTGGRGAKQQRTDWDRTWRVWCERDTSRSVGRVPARSVQASRGNDAFFEQLADIAAQDRAR